MNINSKYLYAVIAILSILCTLLYMTNRNSAREIDEAHLKIVLMQKEVDILHSQTSKQDHTVTTITKSPDGTVTTSIDKVENSTKVSDQSSVIVTREENNSTFKKTVDLERYSVGLYREINGANYSADISARLGNTPFWLTGLTTDSGRDFSLGVKFSW